MQFQMGSGGVPAGNYRGEFTGAEPYLENAERYGEGVLLRWKILGPDQAGEEATRICSAKLTPKSALGKLAVALKGGPIATGERVDFASYVGATGSLIVETTDSGNTRVAAFLRDAQTSAG